MVSVCERVGALIHLRKKKAKNAINSLAQSVFFLPIFSFSFSFFLQKDMLSSVSLAKPFYPPSSLSSVLRIQFTGPFFFFSLSLSRRFESVGLKFSPHATPAERKAQEHNGNNTRCCSGEYLTALFEPY